MCPAAPAIAISTSTNFAFNCGRTSRDNRSSRSWISHITTTAQCQQRRTTLFAYKGFQRSSQPTQGLQSTSQLEQMLQQVPLGAAATAAAAAAAGGLKDDKTTSKASAADQAGLVAQQGPGKRAAEAALPCERCGKRRKESDLASEETAEQDEAPKEEQAAPPQNQQQPPAALSPAAATALMLTANYVAALTAADPDGPMWLDNVLYAATAVRATGVEMAKSLTALSAQGIDWPEYVYPAAQLAHVAWTSVVAAIQAHRAAAAAAAAAPIAAAA
ncbi:hypothetical protein OEZ86_004237 [Tetradesmus obliquus]|nr:hypothetical protein OEZ86_004237 [Tetradesmus obliquus]